MTRGFYLLFGLVAYMIFFATFLYLIGFANIVSIADTKEKALAAMAEPSAWVSNQYATRPDLEGKIADVRPYTPADIVAAAEAGLQGKFAPDVPFSVPAAGTVHEIIDRLLAELDADPDDNRGHAQDAQKSGIAHAASP